MRVLHVDSGREMRGGQWQVIYLLEGLAARGHECVLLAREGSPVYQEASARGMDVRPLDAVRLITLARRSDLTHAHDARAHTLAALLGAGPLAVARRVAFPLSTGLASRWKYGHADHYLAVSRHVGDILRGAGIDENRISVIYDGVPVPETVAPIESRAECIVAPATSDPAKGSDLLAEAAGAIGVHILFTKNLQLDLPKATIFVYITRREGLGSAALLAMAAGAAVVVSRTGGLTEIVEHEVTGLLTENDPGSISRAIRRLQEDPALASTLGNRARARIRDRFPVSAMVDGTAAVYERMLRC